MARENIHTVYDRMNAKGMFAVNPANRDSRDKFTGESLYKGPVKFPKMLYHPEGKTKVVIPARVENGPYGPERRNEQSEIISVIVNSEAELADRLAKGWHEHPADAIAASGKEAPAKSSSQRISSMEAEIEKLRRELAAAKASRVQSDDDDDEAA